MVYIYIYIHFKYVMYTYYIIQQLKFELKGTIDTKLNSLQKLRLREVKRLTYEDTLQRHGGNQ